MTFIHSLKNCEKILIYLRDIKKQAIATIYLILGVYAPFFSEYIQVSGYAKRATTEDDRRKCINENKFHVSAFKKK
jgi:hypothetical protein